MVGQFSDWKSDYKVSEKCRLCIWFIQMTFRYDLDKKIFVSQQSTLFLLSMAQLKCCFQCYWVGCFTSRSFTRIILLHVPLYLCYSRIWTCFMKTRENFVISLNNAMTCIKIKSLFSAIACKFEINWGYPILIVFLCLFSL